MRASPPQVSVVVPAFNAARYIDECLASLCAQTLTRWECIVVDDGSADGTAARVRAHADARIRLVSQPNRGVSAARNAGLALARGAKLLYLDADDLLHPDALRRLAAELGAHRQAVAAYGTAWAIFADGRSYPQKALHRRRFPSGDVLARLVSENFLLVGMLMLRTRVARELGGFDARLNMCEDWDFWCRLAARGPFRFIGTEPEVSRVRVHGGSFSRDRPGAWQRRLASVDAVLSNAVLAARFAEADWRRLGREALASQLWEAGRVSFTARRYAEARRLMLRSLGLAATAKRLVFFVLAQASQLAGVPLAPRLRFVDEEPSR